MNMAIVSNSQSELDELAATISKAILGIRLFSFTDPLLSAKFICNNRVDMVLLQADMRPSDGFTLLKVLRKQKPMLPVAMLANDETNRERAMAAAADIYMVRPITAEKIEQLKELLSA